MPHSPRYMRQTALPEIGQQGQERLAKARILVIGTGGLGSSVLYHLAAAGVGHIGIAEFDTVSESNLNRQILYTTEDIGQLKIEIAAKRLHALNPHIKIAQHTLGITYVNAQAIFMTYDVIVECTDSFNSKEMICHAALRSDLPLVHAAIRGFSGQVIVFDSSCESGCYRCLYPIMPHSEQVHGVLGATAGLIGTVQAAQALMLAAPHPSFAPLVGKLWEIDIRTMHTRTLIVPKDPDCPVCGIKG